MLLLEKIKLTPSPHIPPSQPTNKPTNQPTNLLTNHSTNQPTKTTPFAFPSFGYHRRRFLVKWSKFCFGLGFT
jgi:hypothetical protein